MPSDQGGTNVGLNIVVDGTLGSLKSVASTAQQIINAVYASAMGGNKKAIDSEERWAAAAKKRAAEMAAADAIVQGALKNEARERDRLFALHQSYSKQQTAEDVERLRQSEAAEAALDKRLSNIRKETSSRAQRYLKELTAAHSKEDKAREATEAAAEKRLQNIHKESLSLRVRYLAEWKAAVAKETAAIESIRRRDYEIDQQRAKQATQIDLDRLRARDAAAAASSKFQAKIATELANLKKGLDKTVANVFAQEQKRIDAQAAASAKIQEQVRRATISAQKVIDQGYWDFRVKNAKAAADIEASYLKRQADLKHAQSMRALKDLEEEGRARQRAAQGGGFRGQQARGFSAIDPQMRRDLLDARDLAVDLGIVGNQIRAAFKPAFDEIRNTSRQLALIDSLVDDKAFDRLKVQIEGLPPELGKVSDLLESTYEVLQANVGAENVYEFVKNAAMAAAAEGVKVQDVISGGSRVWALYGKQVGSVSKLFNLLQETVNKGNLKFKDIDSTIGSFVGTAHAAGLRLEEVLAVFAELSRAQGPAQAATSLSEIIRSIVSPTDKAKAAAQEYGVAWDQASLKTKGLLGTLKELHGAGIESAAALNELFRERQARRGAAGIVSAESIQRIGETMRTMGTDLDTNAEKFDRWSQTADASTKRAEGAVNRAYIEMTKSLEGIIAINTALLQSFLAVWGAIPEPIRGAVVTTTALAGEFFLLSSAAVQLGAAGVRVVSWLGKLSTATKALALAPAIVELKNYSTVADGMSPVLRKAITEVGGLKIGTVALGIAAGSAGLEIGNMVAQLVGIDTKDFTWLGLLERVWDKVTDKAGDTDRQLDIVGRTIFETADKFTQLQSILGLTESGMKDYAETFKDSFDPVRLEDVAIINKYFADVLMQEERAAKKNAAAVQELTVSQFESFKALKEWEKALEDIVQTSPEYAEAIQQLKDELRGLTEASQAQGKPIDVAGVQNISLDWFNEFGTLLNMSKEQAVQITGEMLNLLDKETAAWADFYLTVGQGADAMTEALSAAAPQVEALMDAGKVKEAEEAVRQFAETWRIDPIEAIKMFGTEIDKQTKEAEKAAEEQKKIFEDLFNSIAKSTEEADKAIDDAVVSFFRLKEAGDLKGIERLAADLAKTLGVDLKEAVDILEQGFKNVQKMEQDTRVKAAEGWRKLKDVLVESQQSFQDELLASGEALAKAFGSGDMAAVDAQVEALAQRLGVDMAEAYDIAVDAVKKYQDAQKQAADEAEKAAKEQQKAIEELEKSWQKLAQAQREADPRYQRDFLKLGGQLSGSGAGGPSAADQRAVEQFAKRWGIDLKDAIDLAAKAVDEYGKASEKAGKKSESAIKKSEKAAEQAREKFREMAQKMAEAWSGLVKNIQTGSEESKDRIASIGAEALTLGERGEWGKIQQLIYDTAVEFGLDWEGAIAKVNEGIDAYRTKQKEAQEEAKKKAEEAAKAMEELAEAWKDFFKEQRQSGPEYAATLDSFGQKLLQYQGDTERTKMAVEEFARAQGISVPEALGIASTAFGNARDAAQEAADAEVAYLKSVQEGWANFHQVRARAEGDFEGAVTRLGTAMLAADGNMSAIEGTVDAFARQWGLELPEAIEIATGAYQKALEESDKLAGKTQKDLDEIADAWKKFEQDMLFGSEAYQLAFDALGEAILKAGGNMDLIKAKTEAFAKQWGLDLPEAISQASSALSEARNRAREAAEEAKREAEELQQAWDDFGQALRTNSDEYEADVRELGEWTQMFGGDIQALEPFIEAFAAKWGITVPEALSEAEGAYDALREEARRAEQELLDQAARVEDAWTDLFDTFKKESDPYQEALGNLGQDMLAHQGDIEAVKQIVQDFADAWGLDLVEAIQEAQSAFRDAMGDRDKLGDWWSHIGETAEDWQKEQDFLAGNPTVRPGGPGIFPGEGPQWLPPTMSSWLPTGRSGPGGAAPPPATFAASPVGGMQTQHTNLNRPAILSAAEPGGSSITVNMAGAVFIGAADDKVAKQWAKKLIDEIETLKRSGQVPWLNR